MTRGAPVMLRRLAILAGSVRRHAILVGPVRRLAIVAGLVIVSLPAIVSGNGTDLRRYDEGRSVLPPAPPFPPSVYRERRAKVMKEMKGGIAVLYARGEEDRDGFRQDSDFYYLTGIEEPNAVLILSPEERLDKEWLYLEPRNPEDERWTGERLAIGDSLRRITGIRRIGRTPGQNGRLVGLLDNAKTLHVINQPGSITAATPPEQELYGKLSSRIPGVSIVNSMHILPALRSVKEPAELERMEQAIEATIAAHHVAARAIRPGVEENWVEGLIALEFKKGGAVRPGFPSIVGSGRNSTILHYPKHDQTIAPGSLVVVDIGSDYGHYSADVTRTYPADGHFDEEQRRIYEIVLRAQQTCIDMIRPGVYIGDLQRKSEEIIREAGYGDYYIHGLSHFVGLDVHDAGRYSKPLQAGMVITVEPGIYLPEKALGVRIEDEVLVTANGHRHLTSALPRDVESVERMMRGD